MIMSRDFFSPMSIMDNLFNEMIRPMPPMKTFEGMFGGIQTDVKETDINYEVIMNVPGFEKEDIDVSVEDGVLIIKSEKETSNENKENDKYIIKERSSSSFRRCFKLPTNVDVKTISAKMEKGILTLVLPKVEKSETSNKISID